MAGVATIDFEVSRTKIGKPMRWQHVVPAGIAILVGLSFLLLSS